MEQTAPSKAPVLMSDEEALELAEEAVAQAVQRKNEEIAALTEQLQQLQAGHERLTRELFIKAQCHESFRQEHETLKRDVAATKKTNDEHRANITQLRRELVDANKAVAYNADRRKSADQAHSDATARANAQQTRATELERILRLRNDEIGRLKAELSAKEHALGALPTTSRELVEVKQRLATAGRELDSERTKTRELEGKTAELQRKTTEALRGLGNAQEEASDLETKLRSAQQTLTEVDKVQAAHEQKVAHAQAELGIRTRELREAEAALAKALELNATNASIDRRIATLKGLGEEFIARFESSVVSVRELQSSQPTKATEVRPTHAAQVSTASAASIDWDAVRAALDWRRSRLHEQTLLGARYHEDLQAIAQEIAELETTALAYKKGAPEIERLNLRVVELKAQHTRVTEESQRVMRERMDPKLKPETEVLDRYLKAKDILDKGLDPQLLRIPEPDAEASPTTLPSPVLAPALAGDRQETVAEDEEVEEEADEEEEPEIERSGAVLRSPPLADIRLASEQLHRVAKNCGLTPAAVMIASLFELLEPRTSVSAWRVMKSADRANLLPLYALSAENGKSGWDGNKKQAEKAAELIVFKRCTHGSSVPLYSRTSQPLPWGSLTFFTDVQIAAFKTAYKECGEEVKLRREARIARLKSKK